MQLLVFLKNYLSRHTLFLAVLKNKVTILLAYRGIEIDNKTRRGRIPRTKKAFEIQDNKPTKRPKLTNKKN